MDEADGDAVAAVGLAFVRLLVFFCGMIVISSDTFNDAIFDADDDDDGVWRPLLSTDFLLPPLKNKKKCKFSKIIFRKLNPEHLFF